MPVGNLIVQPSVVTVKLLALKAVTMVIQKVGMVAVPRAKLKQGMVVLPTVKLKSHLAVQFVAMGKQILLKFCMRTGSCSIWVRGVEACDDGNTKDGDGCHAKCQWLENGWSCSVVNTTSICIPVCKTLH